MSGGVLSKVGDDSTASIGENLQIAGAEFRPEVLDFLKQFVRDLKTSNDNPSSDPFNQGLNDFGYPQSTHRFSTDPVRILLAARVIRAQDQIEGVGSVADVMADGLHMLADRELDELKNTLNEQNAVKVINDLQLFMNKYFVYNYTSNGGARHARSYGEKKEFKVPEPLAQKVSDLCSRAIQLSFEKSNLVDYFEVLDLWRSITYFLSHEKLEQAPGANQIIEAVLANHDKITPESVERDLTADKDRIKQLVSLEDEQIAEVLSDHRKVLLAKIEEVLGLVKGSTFDGLSPDLDPNSLFSEFQRVRGEGINSYPREQKYREKHRNPDDLFVKYRVMYNQFYELASK